MLLFFVFLYPSDFHNSPIFINFTDKREYFSTFFLQNRSVMAKNRFKKEMILSQNLYEELCSEKYDRYPYKRCSLHEDMWVVNKLVGEYWKPRFLMDARTKTAVEFMDKNQVLLTVDKKDIDWNSLKWASESAVAIAKARDACYPIVILGFSNRNAQVRWTLQPDGQYYMDEDGFGMTHDTEINVIGTIDRTGRVVKKFRYIPQ